MDEALKRLLAAEQRAEQLAATAEAEREQTLREAQRQAQQLLDQFEQRIPEIHAAFADKAGERAAQSVAELERRYDERYRRLREIAEAHESDALDAALRLILPPRPTEAE